jgi:hypothetical protein
MRLLAPALILALSACASAPAAVHPAKEDALESYYPLAVGNAWTYQTRFGKRVEENTVHIVAREGTFFRDDRKSLLGYDRDGLRDGARYLIRRPLRKGATWKSIVEVGKTNHFEILDTGSTVTVPAGTFHDVLVIRGTDDSVPGGVLELEFAYAPSVGLVRIASTMVVGGRERIPQMTIELLSYQVK